MKKNDALPVVMTAALLFGLWTASPLRAGGDFLPFDYDLPLPHDHRAAPAPAQTGPLAVPAGWAIRLFQIFVSPQDGQSCMYAPTCSQYGYIAFQRYGFFTGFLMTGDRWLRCNPFGYPGYDLPEDNYFGKGSGGR